ncbi:MAG: phosphoribosyl-AMP cyclohydrolase [Paracoccaceae bacterium]|jgi:phosphoribosyl-AMP cyclohydrolase
MGDAPFALSTSATLSREELEEGDVFAPRFDADGLIPAITQHNETGDILMFAWMNADALANTIETGEAWYWSRSRNELWHKGATSGQIQKVSEIRTDCDQDVILLRVVPQRAGACHVGYNSCFFRSIQKSESGEIRLAFEETEKVST